MASNNNNQTITPTLLEALLSPDAQRRGEAEAFFQGLPLLERVNGLVQTIQTAANDNNSNNASQQHLVSLAAVLLRRDILRMTDCQASEPLVDPLLGSFLTSSHQATRIAMGHCLAEICGSVSLLSPSPKDKEQVMARILNAISNAVGQGDIPSLRLLAAMAERAPIVFTATAVPSLEQLTRQVASCISENNQSEVLEALMQLLVQAAIASQVASSSQQEMPITPFSTKALDTIDPSSIAASLSRACLAPLMENLTNLMVSPVAAASTLAILQHWTQAASQCPSFLAGDKSVVEAVFRACLAVANTSSQRDDSTTALAALEVISSLCAIGDVKRKLLSSDPALCQQILQGDGSQQGVISLAAFWMTTGMDDDSEGWASEPASLLEEDPWDGDDTAQYAETLLQSFIQNLPKALAVALPLVEQQLQPHKDWRRLCAGLSMMEACLAFAPISFSSHVPVATNAALSLAAASQPIRVQFQGLRLLGVLCEANSPSSADLIRQTYAVQILQTLAHAALSPCTKVSSLACLAIVSFARMTKEGDESANPVVDHLSDILQSLVNGPLSNAGLDRGSVVVKIRAIGAVACIASSSGEAFVPFYSAVMPGLLACSQTQPSSLEACQLVGAAIEGATIVGQAISSDESTHAQYVESAKQIMQFIVPILQQTEGASSDLPIEQLLSACARIADVMGAAYVPYVNMVVPHLLQRATAPPEISVTEGDEAGLSSTNRQQLDIDEDLGTESMTLAVPGKGVQKFTVNTTQIQAKAQAARALYEHADALGADFATFVKPCLDALLPLVSFKFSPEVRSTSALASARIFEAACAFADESNGANYALLQQYFPMLVKTMSKQIALEDISDFDSFQGLADSLSEVHYSLYQRKDAYGPLVASNLSLENDASVVVENAMNGLAACLKRRSDIYRVLSGQEGALTGEDEREECMAQLRQEEQLLTPLVDTVGYTLKMFRERFVPLFDKYVAPVLQPSLTNGDIRAKLSAVCLYDDLVEHCGPQAAASHSEKLVYGILLGIDEQTNGNDKELQSASIYGISQICRYAPSSVLAPHLESIFHQLLKVVKSCSKEESDSPMMYENAVSALASMTLIGKAPFAGSTPVSREELLGIFLDNLPLREDGDEAKICHQGFADLCENGSINVLADVTRVLRVVGETLYYVSEEEEIASQATLDKLVRLIAQMQQQVPSSAMNDAFASVSVEAQNGLNMAMN